MSEAIDTEACEERLRASTPIQLVEALEDEESPEGLYLRARALLLLRRDSEALAALRRATATVHHEPTLRAWTIVAEQALLGGQRRSSQRALENLAEEHGESGSIQLALGYFLVRAARSRGRRQSREGLVLEADRIARRVLAVDSELPAALEVLGTAEIWAGSFSAAQATLSRIPAGRASVLEQQAVAASCLGNRELARQKYDESCALEGVKVRRWSRWRISHITTLRWLRPTCMGAFAVLAASALVGETLWPLVLALATGAFISAIEWDRTRFGRLAALVGLAGSALLVGIVAVFIIVDTGPRAPGDIPGVPPDSPQSRVTATHFVDALLAHDASGAMRYTTGGSSSLLDYLTDTSNHLLSFDASRVSGPRFSQDAGFTGFGLGYDFELQGKQQGRQIVLDFAVYMSRVSDRWLVSNFEFGIVEHMPGAATPGVTM
jgi:hypothetical protein